MTTKKILIVDDDMDLQKVLKKRLEANGFECVSASSVEAGLKELQKAKFSLVLLDLGFQNANGSLFLKCAKNWAVDPADLPPIIVVSGFKDKDIINYVLDLGAVRFLRKPFGPSDLLTVVNDYTR